MVNKGIEAMINIRPIKKDDFSWNLGVNFARNVSEVTKLTDGVDEINLEAAFGSIQSFAIVGQPYGALYGSRWLRNDNGDLVIGQSGLPLYDPENGNIGDARSYFSNFLGDAGGAAEQFVEDGGWVRLRSVSVGREFAIEGSSVFKSVAFNLSARNLWLSTTYRGVDPETSLTGAGSNLSGFDYFNNPGTKSYRLSVTFNF